jgi:hypothetical protein
MLSKRLAPDGAQLFISAKTRTAIPTRCSLLRDALIQATLDPAVRSIEFVPSARSAILFRKDVMLRTPCNKGITSVFTRNQDL